MRVLWRGLTLRRDHRLAPTGSPPRDETTATQEFAQDSMECVGPWSPRSLLVEKANRENDSPKLERVETGHSYEQDGEEVLGVV